MYLFSLDRIDSQTGAAVRCAAALLATENGKTAEPQGSHDHTHHVVREEEDETRILVQHPQRQVTSHLFFPFFSFLTNGLVLSSHFYSNFGRPPHSFYRVTLSLGSPCYKCSGAIDFPLSGTQSPDNDGPREIRCPPGIVFGERCAVRVVISCGLTHTGLFNPDTSFSRTELFLFFF